MKTIRVNFLQVFSLTKTDLFSFTMGDLSGIHYYFQKGENIKLNIWDLFFKLMFLIKLSRGKYLIWVGPQ